MDRSLGLPRNRVELACSSLLLGYSPMIPLNRDKIFVS